MKFKSALLAAVFYPLQYCLAFNVSNTDDWVTVNQTDIYRNLTSCAQSCVQFVNTKIWDVRQNRTCQSWGCVCSNSTQGENFLNGLSNVTSCASQSCGNESEKVDGAVEAYEDLCLVYTLNSTRATSNSTDGFLRIDADGYADTTDCAKFVLNGCLLDSTSRTEAHCEPLLKPDNWEAYRGVADQRQCTDSACLCSDENFDVSIGVAYDAGMRFCAMRPSTKSLPNPQLDDMLNVIATYCASFGFLHRNFTYEYSGAAPGSVGSHGMSIDSKTQIGVAVAALFVAIVSLYLSYRTLKLSREA